jgi:hypothetical protein
MIYLKFGACDLEFISLDTLRYHVSSAGLRPRLLALLRDYAGLTRVSLAATCGSMRQVIRGESV